MENIEIVIGTYENLILGFKCAKKFNGDDSLETSFTDDFHRGALRCLRVSPAGILASSSTDDCVRLHSLIKRKEIGVLFQHSGPVNCITFFQRNHMFTASEDGTICIWKVKNWELLRTLKGHKAHVMAVAVHPTGKLALSIGSDRSLLTWDLLTGKLAFQRKITEAAQNILFMPDGSHYLLVYNKKLEVCSIENTKTIQEISLSWRVNTVCFVEDNIVAVGGDNQHILLLEVLTGRQFLQLDMAKPEDANFSGRVRCLDNLKHNGENLLVAATASGNIKVFKLDLAEERADTLLFYETRARVTSLAAYHHQVTQSESKQPELSTPAVSKHHQESDSENETTGSCPGNVSKDITRKKKAVKAKAAGSIKDSQPDVSPQGQAPKKRKFNQTPKHTNKTRRKKINS